VSALKIVQTRSPIGGTKRQRETLRTLGLRRIGDASVRPDDPTVRGMIRAVAHLVSVSEVEPS